MTPEEIIRGHDLADACDLIFDRFNRMMEVEFGRLSGSRASHGAASSTASPPFGFDPGRKEGSRR